MLPFRTHVILCASLFGALLVLGWGGNILQGTGVIRDVGAWRIPMLVLMIGLVIAFAYSFIPVMVMMVLGFQKTIGNQNVPVVAAVLKQENTIIFGIWALMTAGLVIAIPAAIPNGAFDATQTGTGTKQSTPEAEPETENAGPSLGALVARPGMTLDDMKRLSSGAVNRATQRTPTGALAGGIVFDFSIPGTNITFPRCRYYFVSTYTNAPQHIRSLSVETSTTKLSNANLEAASAALRTRLAADGWRAGHEEYRTEEDQTLHDGAMHGPKGDLWLKNGMVLHIESRRMDDPVAGEDPATAGEWIQFIELWARDDYPGIDRYVFAPGD